MKRVMYLAAVLLFVGAFAMPAQATVIPVDKDFFGSGWVFSPPYIRDAGRDSLGVSTPNPYLMGYSPETTYFTFNFDPSAFDAAVPSAVLRVETVLRSYGNYPTADKAFAISAHRVLDDPEGIDPMLSTGEGSFSYFADNMLGNAEDTVYVNGAGIFEWDVTGLVNEWIANADQSFDYSIAMTGRIGNPADDDDNGAFHAFVNSEGGLGGLTARIVIPEPASISLIAVGAMLAIRRRVAR